MCGPIARTARLMRSKRPPRRFIRPNIWLRSTLRSLTVRQRAQIEEWSKKVPQDVVEKPKDAPLAKKKKTAKKKTASAALKQLQISSFAKLTDAQNYYKEISEKFPVLKTRVPVYKEVGVPRYGLRVRTYLTDTELNLQTLCNLLANEIKSCLITNKN